jgi:hypothetical protein
MFSSGVVVQLLLLAQTRILKPGKVVQSTGNEIVVEFEETLPIELGADTLLFVTYRDKFFQQGVKVRQVEQAATTIATLEKVGEFVSAEQRQIYRTSTLMADVVADLPGEPGCAVADVSPEGFSAITTREYQLGSVLRATLRHEALEIELKARVQTVRLRPDGKFRYGFFAGGRGGITKRAMEQLNSQMQRQQLRRIKRGTAA